MIIKKSTLALCSNSNLHSTLSSASITSYPSPSLQRRPSSANSSCQYRRQYATISDAPSGTRNDRSNSGEPPLPWPTRSHPTPYDILGHTKGSPYRKAAYYRLAKIYHPDTHRYCNTNPLLSDATKLERYRLVVAAHDILSDPSRQRAYDLFGTGWATPTPDSRTGYTEAQKAWRDRPNSCANNATWEDWERWREARDGRTKPRPQEELFMSNAMFVVVIMLFTMVGGVSQTKRAGKQSASLIEARDQKHEIVSAELKRRSMELAAVGREGRVKKFLRERQSWPP